MFGNYLGGVKQLRGRPGDQKRVKGAAPPSRYTKAPTSGPQAAQDVRCQKCLKLGHYTYDCKNAGVYKSRPSRTKQLLNPKKASDAPSVQTPAEFGGSGQAVTSDRLAITSGLAAKMLDDKQKERKKKGGSRSSSSSSDSSSDSDSDSSDSDSSSSSGSSSSGSSDSGSSRSGNRTRKTGKRRASSSHSRSRSPPVRRRRRSSSAASGGDRRSASPVRRRRSSTRSPPRSRSPSPDRGLSIKGKARAD